MCGAKTANGGQTEFVTGMKTNAYALLMTSAVMVKGRQMSRYIDADTLPRHGQRGGLVHWKDIAEAPHIDIVRCENCRDCKEISMDCPSGYGYLYCKQRCSVVNEDDFCAWGTAR